MWHTDLSKLFFLSSPLGSSMIILSDFYFLETLFLKQSASGPDFSIFFSLLSNFFDKITSLSCPFVFLLTQFYHDLCLPFRDHTHWAYLGRETFCFELSSSVLLAFLVVLTGCGEVLVLGPHWTRDICS